MGHDIRRDRWKRSDDDWVGDWGLENQIFTKNFQLLMSWLYWRRKDRLVYPAHEDLFKAFKECKKYSLKAVLVFDQPTSNLYHGLGPSTDNDMTYELEFLFKNIHKTCYHGIEDEKFTLQSPNLVRWARQGVLILSTCLSGDEEGAHVYQRWGYFINSVLKKINNESENLPFVLFGHANRYENLLNWGNNKVIKCPSLPLHEGANHKWTKWNEPFKEVNDYLKKNKILTITW